MSNPAKWYSKLKRMSGLQKSDDFIIEEISNLTDQEQSERIVNYFANTRNSYDEIKCEEFSEYVQGQNFHENFVSPENIVSTIKQINKNAACVIEDVPMKLFHTFSNNLSEPICNLINHMFETGTYPNLWKKEVITPVPKVNPCPTLEKLRPISGIFNVAKIADRLIANYMTHDMMPNRDISQYGNEKGLSVNHYLISMINKILTSVDKNSIKEKVAVILNMIDWSKAFEHQDHTLGIKSFLKNRVRHSLIPL